MWQGWPINFISLIFSGSTLWQILSLGRLILLHKWSSGQGSEHIPHMYKNTPKCRSYFNIQPPSSGMMTKLPYVCLAKGLIIITIMLFPNMSHLPPHVHTQLNYGDYSQQTCIYPKYQLGRYIHVCALVIQS